MTTDSVLGVLEELRDGRLASLRARFAPSLAAQLSEAQLEVVWRQLSGQLGPVREAGIPTASGTTQTLPVHFERGSLELVIALDSEGCLTGLVLRNPTQAKPQLPWVPPSYDKATAYETVEIEVGEGPPLPGTLRIPRERRPVPGVVILHGSGPGDRDGTVNTVKPYRDIAVGLASCGVAVLTFDKRTLVAPGSFTSDATVEDEVLRDGRAAVALLRGRAEVDPRRIVVVGHSQGAMLAPRLAAEGVPVAGLVLLCTPTRSLHEMALEQIRFQASQPGGPPEAEARELLHLDERALARLATLRRGEPVDGPLPFGLSASYLLDLETVDPVLTAARLSIPVHVIQGGRDSQVTEPDLAAWQRAAASSPHVTVSVQKKANHLLVDGRGGPRRELYNEYGHVSKAVVKELAAVILAMSPRSPE